MTHHLFLASNPSFLLFSEELLSDTRLSQQPTGDVVPMNKSTMNTGTPPDYFMRNKPNLCVFWAVSGDCEEKQTQFKPNSKPIQTQNKPNQTQSNPISNFLLPTSYGENYVL